MSPTERLAHSEVTVVIPAFNEASALAPQLQDLAGVMKRSGWAFEIIVVDDGSTDGTAGVAASCGVQVLRLERNGGYGNALKTGIAAARYNWILITDADGTYPPAAIPGLLERASAADMVVGARVGSNVHAPLVRRPAKWLLRQYAGLVALQRIPDLNSGMRLMRKSSVKRFWDLLPSGFSFTTTITLAMLGSGLRVSYVKIDYLKRIGHSKIRPSDFFRFGSLITKAAIRFRPARLLFPAGLLLLLLSGVCAVLNPASSGMIGGLAAGAAFLLAGILLECRGRWGRTIAQ